MQELRRKININGEDFLLAVSQHGEGPPVIGTLGKPGVLYLDTGISPERLYICTAANVEARVYTWRPIEELLKIPVSGDTTVVPGEDGITPHIGENGNWYLGDIDTGVKAAGTDGDDGGYYSPEITPNEADNSFTITFKASKSGMPAVAPATIKLPEKSNDSGENPNGGLSTTAANLLVEILRNGVYSADQSANITALAAELAVTEPEQPDEPDEPVTPEVTLSSISAEYSGGDVTVGTAVSDLTGIVVTAHYSDGSTATVTGYALSGTIVEGSNTITISYGGKSTTFTVTGVAESGGDEEEKTYTDEVVLGTQNSTNMLIYSDEGQTLLHEQSGSRNKCGSVMKADITVKIVVTNGDYVRNPYVGSWDGISTEIVNAVPMSIGDDNSGEVTVTIKAGHKPFFCCESGAIQHVVTMYYNESENVAPDVPCPWEDYENQLSLSASNSGTHMTVYSDEGQTVLSAQEGNIRNKYSDTAVEVDTPCLIVADVEYGQTAYVGSWSGEGTTVVNAVPMTLYDEENLIYIAEVTIKAGCKPYYCVESGSSVHKVTMYY